jgi:hypothetical protein
LAEVGGGEAANEAVDAETAHGLVAEAEAGVDVASHDEAPAAGNRAGLIDGEYAGPERLSGAAAEDAEVIGVLEVFGEHDVAVVKQCSKLRNREVPDAPRVLELVGEACVEDEAPPGGGGLVYRAEWLDEEGKAAVAGNHFCDALPCPGGELGAESDLGSLVAFPTSVVGFAGRL